MNPPPFGTFLQIHPIWQRDPSLSTVFFSKLFLSIVFHNIILENSKAWLYNFFMLAVNSTSFSWSTLFHIKSNLKRKKTILSLSLVSFQIQQFERTSAHATLSQAAFILYCQLITLCSLGPVLISSSCSSLFSRIFNLS